jgi:hypothetical protein
MDEMYNLSVDIHLGAVVILVGLIAYNIFLLSREPDIRTYAYKMRVVIPFSYFMIFTIIFTGAIMMAAKHLDFTIENIVMIILSLYLIPAEIKRYKILKRTNPKENGAFETYKNIGFKILASELGLIMLISIWMMLP